MRLRRALTVTFVVLLTGCSDAIPPELGVRMARQGMLSAALSTSGELAFIGSFNHGGSLWNAPQGERLFDWNHTQEFTAVNAAVFFDDDEFVATTDGNTVAVWDARSGKSVRFWQSPAQDLSITNTKEIWTTGDKQSADYWSRPSRILAMDVARQYALLGQENNVAILIDIMGGSVIGALHHQGPVSSVAMDDNADIAITGSHDGFARVWSLDEGRLLDQWQQGQPVDLVALNSDGSMALAAAYQGPVILWNLKTGETRHLFRRNPGLTSAVFDATGSRILLGTTREKVMLYDMEGPTLLARWQVPNDGPWHKAAILSLSFGDDTGGYLAAASNGVTYTFPHP